MNIGVDAKWYFSDVPSGRVWTREILSRLKSAAPQDHWTFYFRRGDRSRAAELPACDRAVFGSAGWNLISNALVLPLHVSRQGPDVLLTQNFAAPVRTPQVTVVYDAIVTEHPEFFTPFERAYLGCIKPMLRWASTVVTISEASRDQLRRFNYVGTGQACHVVYPGIGRRFLDQVPPSQTARVRAKYGLPERFVLYVGRLNVRKNVGRLIEAVARITDRSVGLVLAGRAEGATEDYPAQAAALGLADRARFLGSVPDDDLAPLYTCASVFAYLSEHEGFGLPPLEAMALGVPVVAAAAPAVREVCGEIPFYVRAVDVEGIAQALHEVLGGALNLGQRVSDGRQRARAFTWDRTTASLVAILEAQTAR